MINKKEYIVYSCIFLFFLVAYLIANTFPDAASAYPQAICTVGMALAVLLIGNHLRLDKKVMRDETRLNESREQINKAKITVFQLKRICIFMGMLLVYVFCIPRVGYYVSTIVYLFASMFVFHKKFSWLIPVISVGFTGVMYLLFDRFLHLVIPSGILF